MYFPCVFVLQYVVHTFLPNDESEMKENACLSSVLDRRCKLDHWNDLKMYPTLHHCCWGVAHPGFPMRGGNNKRLLGCGGHHPELPMLKYNMLKLYRNDQRHVI